MDSPDRLAGHVEKIATSETADKLNAREFEWKNQAPGAWERDWAKIQEIPFTVSFLSLFEGLGLNTELVGPKAVKHNQFILATAAVLERTGNPLVRTSKVLAGHIMGAMEEAMTEEEHGGDTVSLLTAAEIALQGVKEKLGKGWPENEGRQDQETVQILKTENTALKMELEQLQAVAELMESWQKAKERDKPKATEPEPQHSHQFGEIRPIELRGRKTIQKLGGKGWFGKLHYGIQGEVKAMVMGIKQGKSESLFDSTRRLLTLIQTDYEGVWADKSVSRALLAGAVNGTAEASIKGLSRLKEDQASAEHEGKFRSLTVDCGRVIGEACQLAGTELQAKILTQLLQKSNLATALVDEATGEFYPFYEGFFQGADDLMINRAGSRLATKSLTELDLQMVAATKSALGAEILEKGLVDVLKQTRGRVSATVRAMNGIAENWLQGEGNTVEGFVDKIINAVKIDPEQMAKLLNELARSERTEMSALLMEKLFNHDLIDNEKQKTFLEKLIEVGTEENLTVTIELVTGMKRIENSVLLMFGNKLGQLGEEAQKRVIGRLTEEIVTAGQPEEKQKLLWNFVYQSLLQDKIDGIEQLGQALLARTEDFGMDSYRHVLTKMGTGLQLQVLGLAFAGMDVKKLRITDLDSRGLEIGQATREQYLEFINLASQYFGEAGLIRAMHKLTKENVSEEALERLSLLVLSEERQIARDFMRMTKDLVVENPDLDIDVWIRTVAQPFMNEDKFSDLLLPAQTTLSLLVNDRESWSNKDQRAAKAWIDQLIDKVGGGELLDSQALANVLAKCHKIPGVVLTARKLMKERETVKEIEAVALLVNGLEAREQTPRPTDEEMAFIAGNLVMLGELYGARQNLFLPAMAEIARRWLPVEFFEVVVGEVAELCQEAKIAHGELNPSLVRDGSMEIGGVLGKMVKGLDEKGRQGWWEVLKAKIEGAEPNSALEAGLLMAAAGMPRSAGTQKLAQSMWENSAKNPEVNQAQVIFMSEHFNDDIRTAIIAVIDKPDIDFKDIKWQTAMAIMEKSGEAEMIKALRQANKTKPSELLLTYLGKVDRMSWLENKAERFDKGQEEARRVLNQVQMALEDHNLIFDERILGNLLQAAFRDFDITPLEMGNLLALAYRKYNVHKKRKKSRLETIELLIKKGTIQIDEAQKAFLE